MSAGVVDVNGEAGFDSDVDFFGDEDAADEV